VLRDEFVILNWPRDIRDGKAWDVNVNRNIEAINTARWPERQQATTWPQMNDLSVHNINRQRRTVDNPLPPIDVDYSL